MLDNKNKIVVVIPAFNEAKTITEAVNSLKQYAQEVMVVDDGSSDETGLRALKAGASVISHKKRLGYDKAIEDGFKEAIKQGADIVVTFDADGQHEAGDVSKLTKPIIEGKAEMVIGQRPHFTHFFEKIFSLYTKLAYNIKDPLCGLKAYRKEIYESIGYFDRINSIGTQLMIEALHKGFRAQFIPVNINPRHESSRFYYRKILANYKVLRAMIKIIIEVSLRKYIRKL